MNGELLIVRTTLARCRWADLPKLNLGVSGDMNELGEYSKAINSPELSVSSVPLQKARTCIAAVRTTTTLLLMTRCGQQGTSSDPVIVDDKAYPLDPDFEKYHSYGKVHNEEHKALHLSITPTKP